VINGEKKFETRVPLSSWTGVPKNKEDLLAQGISRFYPGTHLLTAHPLFVPMGQDKVESPPRVQRWRNPTTLGTSIFSCREGFECQKEPAQTKVKVVMSLFGNQPNCVKTNYQPRVGLIVPPWKEKNGGNGPGLAKKFGGLKWFFFSYPISQNQFGCLWGKIPEWLKN